MLNAMLAVEGASGVVTTPLTLAVLVPFVGAVLVALIP